MKRRAFASAALAAALAGCQAVGPDYRLPPVLADSGPAPELTQTDAAVTSAPLPENWWRLYRDPALNGYVEDALAHNADLRTAAANLASALALLDAQEARRQPQTDLNVNPTYGQESADAKGAPEALDPGVVYKATQMVSYDFDLFGRLRRGIEAQDARAGAAQAALDLARVNIASQTTLAYVDICSANLRIAVQRAAIRTAEESLHATTRRFQAGVAGRNDVVRARTLLHQTQAALPPLNADQQGALLRLATLTGHVPQAAPQEALACEAPPELTDPIPVGDGRALLRRRPDIRQAERQLARTVAQIGVQTADLYPSISLGGMIGTTATKIEDIVKDRGFRWSIGPLVSWTFPNRSAARAQIGSARFDAEAQLATFDGTVLTALRETDTALVVLARDMDRQRDLELARDDAAEAARNVGRLYRGGVADFLELLDAQRTLIDTQTTLAQARAAVASDQVQLFQALGGGWQDAPPVIRIPIGSVTEPDE